MTELIKYTPHSLREAHPEISLEMVRINHAEYPTVSMLSPKEAKQVLTVIVSKVFLAFNKEVTPEQLRSMVEMLYQDIITERDVFLRSITIEEIHRALTRAKSHGELFPTESSIFETIYKYYNEISLPTSARMAGRVLTYQNQ